jgi:hypothetical protein
MMIFAIVARLAASGLAILWMCRLKDAQAFSVWHAELTMPHRWPLVILGAWYLHQMCYGSWLVVVIRMGLPLARYPYPLDTADEICVWIFLDDLLSATSLRNQKHL